MDRGSSYLLSSKILVSSISSRCFTSILPEKVCNIFTLGSAYLAQSPQLYKQMVIAADFDRVYTIGGGKYPSPSFAFSIKGYGTSATK